MEQKSTKQKLVTVTGSTFTSFVIWDLLTKAFEAYQQLDHSKRHFQTSMWEHGHASAAIVLTVISIEAYRNGICYLSRRAVSRGAYAVPIDLSDVLLIGDDRFPAERFKNLLAEMFVVRDVIVHNHIYEVEVTSDEHWEMVRHEQKLLKGYGRDAKYSACVNDRTRRTKLLRLNVQPAKMGFEDLFKMLITFDLFVGVTENLLGKGYVPASVQYQIEDRWVRNVSEVLTHYLGKVTNQRFIAEVAKLSAYLRKDFANFLPPMAKWDWFITNICPSCSSPGFFKKRGQYSCSKCGAAIRTSQG